MELGGKSPLRYFERRRPRRGGACASIPSFSIRGADLQALSRLVVPKDDKETVERLLLQLLPEYVVGDPTDPAVRCRPRRVRASIPDGMLLYPEGNRRRCGPAGGGLPPAPEKGYYVYPTIFTDVTNDMTIAREEIFGPSSVSLRMTRKKRPQPLPTTRRMAGTPPSGGRKSRLSRRRGVSGRATSISTTGRAM